MKLIGLGMVAGGAAVATMLGMASANADADTTPAPKWSPVYDIDSAKILQQANSFTNTWEVGSKFTHGSTTLTGNTYLAPSTGGLNTTFIDENKDIYNQNQLGLGFTNLYYDKGGDGKDVVDVLKTPFGNINMNSMAWLFTPMDVSKLHDASPLKALESAGLYSALDLGLDKDAPKDLKWSPTYGNLDDAKLLVDKDPFSETWKLTGVHFTRGDDILSGTNYVTQSLFGGGINDQFVTQAGDVYNQNQLGFGFTNLYYNPAGDSTAAIDILKTPFGNIDMSWAASWFAPTDYSHVDVLTPDADLANAGLYSALDLGLVPPAA